MDFEGGEELQAAIMDLPHTTARNSARRMLKKAGELIASAAAANAPERGGALRESYGVGTTLTTRQRRLARGSDKGQVEVYVGPGKRGYRSGVQTEFGSKHQAAQPHLRPAFDSENRNALDLIARDWWADIEKTWARRARKMAKRG
jgi:HK97 gp10 family phage protein